MIRKMLVVLFFLAAMSTLVIGILSYWRGVPGNTLWINSADQEPRVRLAMIDGTLHAVYSGPREGGRGLYEMEFGQFYVKRVDIGAVDAAGVGAPFWSLFIVLVLVPFTAFGRGPLRRRRRRRRGECIHCGYNLTGLIEHRCPECGREFTPPEVRPEPGPAGQGDWTLNDRAQSRANPAIERPRGLKPAALHCRTIAHGHLVIAYPSRFGQVTK